MRTPEVVVGVDASPESLHALRWAAAEAHRRGTRLHIVHAIHPQWQGSAFSPHHAQLAARWQASTVTATALADVREWAPDVEVDAREVAGGAAAALITAAQPGDLVVVGSRGHSEFAALLAGSTCQQVAMHASTSVVVVRGQTGRVDGGVVAGFDGSSEDVLAISFQMADELSRPLTVLRAFRPSMPAWPVDAPPPDVLNATTAQAALRADLQAMVMPLAEKYPTVRVRVEVAGGNPALLLAEASRDAQLVVVGSRGHGGFAGLLLGSVGLHLVHHACCPVLLARR